MMYPSITTVAQPIYEMGKIATELLLEQMEGNTLEEKHYRLPIEIIERNTTSKEMKQMPNIAVVGSISMDLVAVSKSAESRRNSNW